nr:hypothetical protein [Tanacetum cinerariifolium]
MAFSSSAVVGSSQIVFNSHRQSLPTSSFLNASQFKVQSTTANSTSLRVNNARYVTLIKAIAATQVPPTVARVQSANIEERSRHAGYNGRIYRIQFGRCGCSDHGSLSGSCE